MPKVTEEYIKNKKKMIVRAAYDLCIQKTVSTVTMQDIIDATGFSQGGIYRFYKDIGKQIKRIKHFHIGCHKGDSTYFVLSPL